METKFDPKKALIECGVEPQLADDYLALRKAKKAPVTHTVLKLLLKKVQQTPYSLTEVLEIIIDKNWQGFEPSWVNNNQFKPLPNANFTNVGNMQATETKMQRNTRVAAEAYEANLKLLRDYSNK